MNWRAYTFCLLGYHRHTTTTITLTNNALQYITLAFCPDCHKCYDTPQLTWNPPKTKKPLQRRQFPKMKKP